MKSYQVLKEIFDGKIKRLADAWGVKVNSAAKFLRDPEDSGAPNPIDRFSKVVDEAVLANRPDSGLIVEYVRQYWMDAVGKEIGGDAWDPKQVAAEILQTSTKAVQALALNNLSAGEQLKALVEARQVLDEAILRLGMLDGEEGR
jgi:hypothetical protein